MEQVKTIRGYLNKIIYKNNDNSWGIGIFSHENNNKKTITIKGNICLLENNVLYEIKGNLEEHIKYGKSINVISYKIGKINSKIQFINYLKSNIFPNIGEHTANKIASYYSDSENIIDDILNNKEHFFNINNVKKEKLEIIYSVLLEINNNEKLIFEFINNNLDIGILIKVKNKINDEKLVLKVLKNNWYTYVIKNRFSFIRKKVDKIGLYYNDNDLLNEKRLVWYMYNTLTDILNDTCDTYTDIETLYFKFTNIISISEINFDIFKKILDYCINEKFIIIENDRVYINYSYNEEVSISKNVAKLIKINNYIYDEEKFENSIYKIEQEENLNNKNFKFDISQIDALKKFIKNKISIITGGAGTGKSTIINSAVKLYKNYYDCDEDFNYSILTPTGKSANRIKESFPYLNVKTLHRELGWDNDQNFIYNKNNPLKGELFIIDECSMIDNRIFSQLLEAAKKIKKILIIGDSNQLPSIGYGDLFLNLINSNLIEITKLEFIHRQKENNGIIKLSNDIKNNHFNINNINDYKNTTFIFDQDLSINKIVKLYKEKMNENIQIISPMYASNLGVENLNKIIQSNVNQNIMSTDSYFKNKYYYSKNDKVMYLVNDLDLELSNGDTGVILNINNENEKFNFATILFNNKEYKMTNKHFDNITLNYVCTVHKTQGSEYDYVILVINNYDSLFLNKQLIYTAITRAKKEIVIVGNKDVFINSINREIKKRKTTLIERLKYEYNKF